VDVPGDEATPDGSQAELSKREKRQLREAKKALLGQVTSHTCNVCKEQFESKTKLFAHINNTGHALASPEDIEHHRTKKGKKEKR